MKRLLKEPLLHFVVLGALLFGAYSWLNHGASHSRASRQVRIGETDVRWLKETWARQWQREPTTEELRSVVTAFLREELLAREAHVMGLDENDAFVRRWLAQKVEFLVKDTSRLSEPTENELQKFYAAHPERFQIEARVSFTQIFFSSEGRKNAVGDAKSALMELTVQFTNGTPHAPLGDQLFIDTEFHNTDEQTVAAQFGREFARSIFALMPGVWSGPIESGYGLHLVRVSELKPGRQREFAEAKTQVLERWHEQRQREDNEKYFAGLLKKYDVVLDESVRPLVGPLGESTQDSRGNKEVPE